MYGARMVFNRRLRRERWMACVKRLGKEHYLGSYSTEAEASAVAVAWAEEHPSAAKFKAREDAPSPCNLLEPVVVEPTTAPPGTPAKIAVLTERATKRAPLWHPRDRVEPYHWLDIVNHVRHLTPDT